MIDKSISLKPFGYNKALYFEATKVLANVGKTPLLVLLPENHLDNDVKAENLQVACQFIDEGIVDLVAVEERFKDEVNAEVLKEVIQQYGFPSIQAYSEDLLSQLGGDHGVFKAIRERKTYISFAKQLLYLRPQVRVASVEDPELAARADKEAASIALEFTDEPDPAERERKRTAKFRHLQINRDREAAFLKNIMDARRRFGLKKGIILNAGGFHHENLREGFGNDDSFLLIYPPSYKAVDL